MTLFRLSATEEAIRVECWPGWAAFDAAPSPAPGLWSDLAYEMVPPQEALANGAGIVELQRLRVQNGHMAAVEALLAIDAAAWRAAGARFAAAFKVVHGDDMPACLMLLGWPCLAAALEAQPVFESAALPAQARRDRREAQGLPVIRGSSRLFRAALIVDSHAEVTPS